MVKALFSRPERSRRRRFAGMSLSMLLVLGLLSFAPRWTADASTNPMKPKAYPSVHSVAFTAKPPAARPDDAASIWRPPATSWPTAGTAEAVLSPAKAVAGNKTAAPGLAVQPAAPIRAGSLPVWVARPGAVGPDRVTVTVADHADAERVGVSGLLVDLRTAAGKRGPVDVSIDYGSIAYAYGGDYASRLTLVTMPACAVTTPAVPACLAQTPLHTNRDSSQRTLNGRVSLPAAPAGAAAEIAAARTSPPVVLAVTAGAKGDSGDYGSTPLNASGSWSTGGNSGDFTYSYPIAPPPVPGGLVPDVALSYSAQSVDGEQVATNNQASWIGDGWSYSPGYVERSYVSCNDSTHAGAPKTDDDCWAGQVVHVAFGSVSGDLVYDPGTPTHWSLSDDDGTKVEQVVPADKTETSNGTFDGDYWKFTTRDGTQYFFGLNRLPGYAAGKTVTNSALTVPVYDHPDGCPTAMCQLAWRWNLDYIVNPHRDAAAFYYNAEQNYYGANKATTGVAYERGGWLDHIDYGLSDPNAYASAPARVAFTTTERCIDTAAACAPANLPTNKTKWPDVPADQICDKGKVCALHTPTFFSRRRLVSIATQITNGSGGWKTVDSYALSQSFADPKDGTASALWLQSVQHTGGTGAAAIVLPPVAFKSTILPNRADGLDGAPAMNHHRISTITTETGETIAVNYKTECKAPVTLDPKTNKSLCYPVYWAKQGQTTPTLDWFHKYVVTEIDDQDGSNKTTTPLTTTYEYLDGGAWHYDDNELVKAKYRTWGQWRGFGRVRTRVGAGNDPKTLTEDRYFRGMDGDFLATGSQRNATVGLSADVPVAGAAASVPDRLELAGQARESIVYNGAAPDHATVTDFWVGDASASRTRSGLPALTARKTGTVAARTTTALTATSPTTWRTTLIETSYDTATGLAEVVYDHGDITKPEQARCTSTEYAPANAGAHLIGLVSRVEVDAAPCGGSGVNGLTPPTGLDRPADVVSVTRTFYDDEKFATTWPQQPPTAGDKTMTQVAETYRGGDFVYRSVQRTKYDGYGRPTDTLDARGGATATAYTDTNGLTTQSVSKNQLGQPVTSTFDPSRGAVVAVEDANHLVTDIRYDLLGRRTGVWNPGRDRALGANTVYSYLITQNAPSAITTQALRDDGLYATTVTFYDALRRPRQTQSWTPVGGRLLTDTFYDSRGWAYKVNNAYYDNSSGPTTTMLDMTGKDQQIPNEDLITFDGVGRPVTDVSNFKGVAAWKTMTVYGGDRTTVIPPPGGTPTTAIVDAGGRAVETRWYSSMPTVSGNSVTGGTFIKHTATFAAKTTTVADDAGHTWSSTVDLLGQVVRKTDPDVGTTTMTYDDLGRTATTTDSRGKTIASGYDALGRRTGTFDGSDTNAPQLARWTYDTASPNGVGKLASSTRFDHQGDTTYEYTTAVTKGYDLFGQALGTSVTIPADPANGALAGTYDYLNQYKLTSGLIIRRTYTAHGGLPAEKVGYTYSQFGLPVGVGSSVNYGDLALYTPFGQVDNFKMGLGTGATASQVSYLYDEHTNLLNHTRLTGYTGGPVVDELSYEHNPAAQLTSVTDVRNGAAAETQCYQYGLLGRLSEAWTATDKCAVNVPATKSTATIGGIQPYWTSWQYNDSGDRTSQTEHATTASGADTTTKYTYPDADEGQPHTLRTASSTGPLGTSASSFGYDDAGNTVQRTTPDHGTQSFQWNSEGQLASVAGNDGPPAKEQSASASYLYDPDGGTLIERDTTNAQTTLYLPGEELTLATGTGAVSGLRYYATPGGATAVRTGVADSSYSFLIDDPQGTSSLTLDHDTKNPVWRDHTPYGGPRGPQPQLWPDTHGYLGQPTDSATGLDIFGARQYDPALGRFLSADPVLETDDPNQIGGYTYAGDDPINGADPSGLINMKLPAEGGGAPVNQPTGGGGGGTNHGSDGTGNHRTDGEHSKHGWSGVGHGIVGGLKAFAYDPFVDIYHQGVDDYHDNQEILQQFSDGDASFWDLTKYIGKREMRIYPPLLLWNFGKGTYNEFKEGFAANNAEDRTRHLSNGIFNIGSLFVGGELFDGLKAAEATGDVAKGAEVAADEGKAAEGAGSARVEGCSFDPATAVLMADGTTKPISDVAAGDKVTATNPVAAATTGEPVTALHRNIDTHMADIRTVDAAGHLATVHTTANHRFWNASTLTWVAAGNLHPGDRLQSVHGSGARVVSVYRFTATKAMYNLTVEDLHTYYVLAGTIPVLVHNDNGGIDLSNATEVRGRFPVGGALDAGGPANGILYRTQNGAISNYAVYDADGVILRRVDLVGAAHGGVATPHVQEFTRNVAPDGRIFPQQSRIATPAGPGDLPRVGC